MKKILMALLVMVVMTSAATLYDVFNDNPNVIDTTALVVGRVNLYNINWYPYYDINSKKILTDSFSPCGHGINMCVPPSPITGWYDVNSLMVAYSLPEAPHWAVLKGGWSILMWVRFDSKLIDSTNLYNIQLLYRPPFSFNLNPTGTRIQIQSDSAAYTMNSYPDTEFPYNFKSDSVKSLFDNYYHLVAITYTDSTGKYSAYADGKLISCKSNAAGVPYRTAIYKNAGYRVGNIKYLDSMQTVSGPTVYWYWVQDRMGMMTAGFKIMTRPLLANDIKQHFDTTIIHAPMHQPVVKTESALSPTSAFSTLSVFPNPATTSATIRFNVSGYQKATVKVYDITGKIVETLVDGKVSGENAVAFRFTNIAKGLYFVELKTTNRKNAVSLLLTK
jgi:hypothetical protein